MDAVTSLLRQGRANEDYVMSCDPMSCHVMSCCVMLYYSGLELGLSPRGNWQKKRGILSEKEKNAIVMVIIQVKMFPM